MINITEASDIVFHSKRIVVFTGAGMSTESGIPDFRSPGGIWDRYDPNELTYQKFLTSQAGREKYWERQKTLVASDSRRKTERRTSGSLRVAQDGQTGLYYYPRWR